MPIPGPQLDEPVDLVDLLKRGLDRRPDADTLA
jgi:hypothetical protein